MAGNVRDSCTIYIVAPNRIYHQLITEALPDVNVEFYQTTGYKYDIEVPKFEEDPNVLQEVEILFTTPYIVRKYADRLNNLKWMHSSANGVDALVMNNSSFVNQVRDKFIITKLHGSVNAPNTTEYVIGQIIARERNFLDIKQAQRSRDWDTLRQKNSYRSLAQLTIGIMGLGGIGDYMAKQCKALGMCVWGLTRHRRSQAEKQSYVDEYRTQEDLIEFLEHCDYICSVLPNTEETVGMLSGDVFKHCSKKKGVFINCGRGDVTDEHSIIKAIQNEWIGGAILDCAVEEPLYKDSPLWTTPGVTITPHVSGWSHSTSFDREGRTCPIHRTSSAHPWDKHRANVVRHFVDNYQKYIENQPLFNVFDWDRGY